MGRRFAMAQKGNPKELRVFFVFVFLPIVFFGYPFLTHGRLKNLDLGPSFKHPVESGQAGPITAFIFVSYLGMT